jgi:3-hydroxyisobutyrate dehydrogenase-like beta-hydroxyacid dehydrogenase
LLRHPGIQSGLRGKILVQLTTGTPDGAREMGYWAQSHAIEYLDGAILGNPIDIGKPQIIALCSGSEKLFNRMKPTLVAFDENAMFIGKEIGHASANEGWQGSRRFRISVRDHEKGFSRMNLPARS